MNYSEIVGIVRERNRPSGGIKTVQEVAVNGMIKPTHKVLEIGSNTGFTSVNLALLTDCSVVGIDLLDTSIQEARLYAKAHKVENLVSFKKSTALEIPYENDHFDFIWASNVTSFINDKRKVLKEYSRVLKMGGILVMVPIYYHKRPPKELIHSVSKAIGSKIEVWDKDFWIELIKETKDPNFCFEPIYQSAYRYDDKDSFVEKYVENIFDKEHLKNFDKEKFQKLKKEYTKYIHLFNENLKYAEYSVLLFQKRRLTDEQELFTTKKIS